MNAGPIMSPEAVARWWGIDPALRSPAGGIRGACALWQFENDADPIEVVGDPDPDTHTISIGAGGRSKQDYFGDGRLHFTRPCLPGLMNIVRAGERPRAILTGDTRGWSYFHVYLPHAVLAEVAVEADLGINPAAIELVDPQGAEDGEVWTTARTLLRELREGGPLSRLRIETLHQDIAIQLLRRHSNLLGHPHLSRRIARGGLASWQLKRTTDAIEARLDEDISLDMLAGVAGCSPTHFSRAFKQSTGIPPFQWLLERRVERAKELLVASALPLAEVALAVGFSAQPQFTTAFRRATGITPGAWRRERLS